MVNPQMINSWQTITRDIDVKVVEGAIKSDYWCVSLLHISFYFIIIITIFLFLAVERNFWILEVDSVFLIEMKCF